MSLALFSSCVFELSIAWVLFRFWQMLEFTELSLVVIDKSRFGVWLRSVGWINSLNFLLFVSFCDAILLKVCEWLFVIAGHFFAMCRERSFAMLSLTIARSLSSSTHRRWGVLPLIGVTPCSSHAYVRLLIYAHSLSMRPLVLSRISVITVEDYFVLGAVV